MQRRDALLDPRAGTIVQADDRQAHGRRHVHDLLDLLAVRLAERSAEDREVLGEDADLSSVDRAEAGDDTVGVRARVLKSHARRAVARQHVEFLERVLVEEVLDTFARGHLALGLVSLDRGLTTREARLGLACFEFRQTLCH